MSDKTTAKTDAGQPINVILQQPDRAAEGAANMVKAQEILAKAEEAPSVYELNGQKVDGNGDPIKKSDDK